MMKHKVTQELFAYWNALRDGRIAPTRGEIEPRDIRRILPYIFILERRDSWSYRFRLAGTGLCNIYGTEFRGHNMLNLWQSECQSKMNQLLDDVVGSASVGLVDYTAETPDRREATLEMVLLPLAQDNGAITRVLGAATPLDDLPWLGDYMLTRQWIGRAQLIDPEKLAAVDPAREFARRIAREEPPRPTRIAGLGTRHVPLRTERPYLRLVKSETLKSEDAN